jgi:NAD(P)-dependent dehydrogenase (short-subunit alcohol dehydrogenase family)
MAISDTKTGTRTGTRVAIVTGGSGGIGRSGAWDGMGEGKDKFFADTAARNPVRRIGQPADIFAAALLALTNPFRTGTTLHVDVGGRSA